LVQEACTSKCLGASAKPSRMSLSTSSPTEGCSQRTISNGCPFPCLAPASGELSALAFTNRQDRGLLSRVTPAIASSLGSLPGGCFQPLCSKA
jgi:hypothetical protein